MLTRPFGRKSYGPRLISSSTGEHLRHKVIVLVTLRREQRVAIPLPRQLPEHRVRSGIDLRVLNGVAVLERVRVDTREPFDDPECLARSRIQRRFMRRDEAPAVLLVVDIRGLTTSVFPSQWPRRSPTHWRIFGSGRDAHRRG